MPVKRSTRGLFAKLGTKLNQSVEAHREDEIVLAGGIDLPSGIDFGIAQLVDCKFSVYKEGDNKGEYFFYAAGVVMSPEEITDNDGNKIPVKGLRTQLGPEPICDTPKAQGKKKTLDDHIAFVVNELRKLGAEGAELSGENLEATANALKETKPFFRFRTWKGEKTDQYPNPRVNHDWRGACEYTDSGDSGVEDDSPEAEETEEETPKKTVAKPSSNPATASKGVKKGNSPSSAPKASTKGKAPAPEPEPDEDEFAVLGTRADTTDDSGEFEEDALEAQRALDSQAKLFNIPQKKIDAAANWTEVADLIRAASEKDEKSEKGEPEEEAEESEEVAEEEEAEEPTVKVGDVFLYKFAGAKKATEVEITKVDEATQTCTVKNLDTGKVFSKISWDKLEEAT